MHHADRNAHRGMSGRDTAPTLPAGMPCPDWTLEPMEARP
jgi:hypothetical protein